MADMLVRGIPEETKRRLAARAEANGRSQNAELLAILEEALPEQKKTWLEIVREAAEEIGGVELQLPERHAFREFSFQEA